LHLTGTMRINGFGNLEIGGVDATKLVEQYQTPLWVIDETGFRENCRAFRNAFRVSGDTLVLYASKALCNTALCKIVNEEGLGLDVVSGGELFTAMNAGFPMEKVYFHGNNKTLDEIDMGVKLGVGKFVVDNFYEMEKINSTAKKYGKIQEILLRVTPGIEAHTHDYIKTGQIDSKFGFTMLNDEVMNIIKGAVDFPNLKFDGIHCHIGSQIFETKPYEDEVEIC